METVKEFKDYSQKNNESVITTTRAVEEVDNEQILDVEMLLPISCCIPVENPYIYKEKIKITNALYAKVEQVEKINEAMNEVNQYIISNGLQPLTSAYIVQTKEGDKLMSEIYIGLNPNIL